jgi:hypothetical protein
MKWSITVILSIGNNCQRLFAVWLAILFILMGSCYPVTAQNNEIFMQDLEMVQPESLTISAHNNTGVLESINAADLQNLQIPANQNSVIQFSRNLSGISYNELRKVNEEALRGIEDDQIRRIPELHVESAGNGGSNNNIVYQPVITSFKPLTYDYTSEKFTSSLNFMLLSTEDRTDNISNPVLIELHSNYLESINPNQLKINHLNLPSTSVDVASQNAQDSVQVRIVTKTNTDGYETYLKVEPTLSLFSNRNSIQGFGVQKIPLQVRWLGSTSQGSKQVTLSTSKGSISPNTLELKYNTPRTVYVRSEGTGQATITASTSGSQSNELNITFGFPWMFLLFSVLGGFIGGTAKYFALKEKPKSFLTTTIGSLAIGFIGAIAYFVLGINLLNLEFSSTFNEFAVLGASALIAYFGIRKL